MILYMYIYTVYIYNICIFTLYCIYCSFITVKHNTSSCTGKFYSQQPNGILAQNVIKIAIYSKLLNFMALIR